VTSSRSTPASFNRPIIASSRTSSGVANDDPDRLSKAGTVREHQAERSIERALGGRGHVDWLTAGRLRDGDVAVGQSDLDRPLAQRELHV
jgi:hypothetical protein